jgi:hypothetical protein
MRGMRARAPPRIGKISASSRRRRRAGRAGPVDANGLARGLPARDRVIAGVAAMSRLPLCSSRSAEQNDSVGVPHARESIGEPRAAADDIGSLLDQAAAWDHDRRCCRRGGRGLARDLAGRQLPSLAASGGIARLPGISWSAHKDDPGTSPTAPVCATVDHETRCLQGFLPRPRLTSTARQTTKMLIRPRIRA